MTVDELKDELRSILAEEEQDVIDWVAVEHRSLGLTKRLLTEDAPDYPHEVVYHFLDDFDIRKKDRGYAERQRGRLHNYLSGSR